MNKVILMGRLTADPDIKEKVTSFNLAVDRRYKKDGEKETDFPRCIAFGKTKEFIDNYMKKGTKVVLEGEIRTGRYTSIDGSSRSTTDVLVDNIEFAESKAKKEEPQEGFAEADQDGLPFA